MFYLLYTNMYNNFTYLYIYRFNSIHYTYYINERNTINRCDNNHRDIDTKVCNRNLIMVTMVLHLRPMLLWT